MLCEMQSASSRIWTRVAVSISYDDNNYTTFEWYQPVKVILCLEIMFINWLIGLVGRVFANGPGDLGSLPDRVIPKTLKIVLDTSLLNTQQYEVHIKGKVEQSRKRNGALPYSSV